MPAKKRRNPYSRDLDKNAANFEQLSPITFLERAAAVYPDRVAVVHGNVRRTWAETATRARKLASALKKKGYGTGDTIAFLGANTPETFEAHFGVPMMGAVLNTINTRLDAEAIAFILNHGESRILFVDREFSATAKKAIKMLGRKITVVDIDDPQYEGGERLSKQTYDDFIAKGDAKFPYNGPADEWDAIALNYTSGTTGNPKGVVTHHRGAYLNAVSNALSWGMTDGPVYLWTLPMFHCNGWCFPWTMALMAGTSVCLRAVRADAIYKAIATEKVTHLCGAPIVMNLINNAPEELRKTVTHKVKTMVAGAAPPAAVIAGMEKMGWEVTHVYGLTETYGPCMVNVWHDKWNSLPMDDRSAIKSRQGVRAPMQEAHMVANPKTMKPVPKDGQTMGEIFMRGNIVMSGYLKNPKATKEAFRGGWFHSGDLAVWHPDGYCEIKDRSKDIIISGGENISSIEVEGILYKHPAVLEAAVAARPDNKWGETPCAFVTLKEGGVATEADIISFCKQNMAGFKVPKTVIFGPLPKTSTGKIQKFMLRDRAKALGEHVMYKAPLADIKLALKAAGIGKFPEAAESADSILEEAAKLAENVIAPLYRKGDLQHPKLKDGIVHVTPGWTDAWRQMAEGGWLGISGAPEHEGMGMPEVLGLAVNEIFESANLGFALSGLLTQGAAYALNLYGSADQKARFLPKLYSGTYAGTMNLTEPQAGSDLAALRSTATPSGSHYLIKGQKIFISYGDHEMTENILHLVLARLPDAPPGVKGISLFAVPKIINGKRNDIVVARLEDKMGLHSSPTCVMLFGEKGGAIGELIGEPHRGLEYMFAMMNHARMDVGMQGLAIASRAYQQALHFSRERVQGKPVGHAGSDKATIIHHPDVRRLLVSMKARINAMRGLLYDVAAARDLGDDKRAELLIPVAKGWCTELAQEVVSDAVQVFGGMGYVEETGIAQCYRDARILSIYEGTTAIQANALVGRSLMRDKGAYFGDYIKTLGAGPAVEGLKNSADFILAQNDMRVAFASSVPFLNQVGTVAGAEMLRRQGEADPATKPLGDFFNAHVLPRAWALNKAVTQGAASVFALDEAAL